MEGWTAFKAMVVAKMYPIKLEEEEAMNAQEKATFDKLVKKINEQEKELAAVKRSWPGIRTL
jgi:hypothetical protein